MAARKSLVTGGTGFIGSHLVEALLGRGDAVRCLVRDQNAPKWIRGLDVEIVEGDCNDLDSLRSAAEGVDQVYHVAGITKAASSQEFYRGNAVGTENLIKACLEGRRQVDRFVYLSSQAAVGPCEGDGLSLETDPCRPVSHYGRSKRLGEEAVLGVRDRLSVLILRACSVYGPRDRDFLPLFRSIARGIQIGLRGMDHRLSLCYVEDLVTAMAVAGRAEMSSGEVFFISDGGVYAWGDIGAAIAEILGVRTIHLDLPLTLFRWAAVLADGVTRWSGKPRLLGRERYEELVRPNWCCDSTKAMSELGFSPSFDLKRGIAATVAWYRAAGWLDR
jgi:dihydroflavonol-4-reductase